MTSISRLLRRPQGGYRFASAWLLGLAMVGAGVSSPDGRKTLSAQAPNACALLTNDEIQHLADASVTDGAPSSLEALGSMTCRYTWGVGVNRFTLDVLVNEASRKFRGMSPDQIKQQLLGSVRVGTADAVLSDIGEAAVFTTDSPLYATASASLKGRILEVHLDGFVARDKKDQVIALLKSAASRL
jgi:hypothetical protein